MTGRIYGMSKRQTRMPNAVPIAPIRMGNHPNAQPYSQQDLVKFWPNKWVGNGHRRPLQTGNLNWRRYVTTYKLAGSAAQDEDQVQEFRIHAAAMADRPRTVNFACKPD
ncbi:hypothetical protein SLA2020_079120 [Shorea laevis]